MSQKNLNEIGIHFYDLYNTRYYLNNIFQILKNQSINIFIENIKQSTKECGVFDFENPENFDIYLKNILNRIINKSIHCYPNVLKGVLTFIFGFNYRNRIQPSLKIINKKILETILFNKEKNIEKREVNIENKSETNIQDLIERIFRIWSLTSDYVKANKSYIKTININEEFVKKKISISNLVKNINQKTNIIYEQEKKTIKHYQRRKTVFETSNLSKLTGNKSDYFDLVFSPNELNPNIK